MTVQEACGVLGIRDPSEYKEIRDSFLALSKTHHPDLSGNQERYLEILQAYRLLKSQFKKEYATSGAQGDLKPLRGQGELFAGDTEVAPGKSISEPSRPELNRKEALDLFENSSNPYLRLHALKELGSNLDRELILRLMNHLHLDNSLTINRALVKVLLESEIPLARIGARIYLVRRAGFMIRQEFLGLIKWPKGLWGKERDPSNAKEV